MYYYTWAYYVAEVIPLKVTIHKLGCRCSAFKYSSKYYNYVVILGVSYTSCGGTWFRESLLAEMSRILHKASPLPL
jgi:hypothetical protein